MQSTTKSCWKHICTVSYILFSKICCGSKMEQLLTQHKLPCKSSGQCFQVDSFLISGKSPGSPTSLPDLAVPDYFLWDYVKNKVYETRPANIDDLKQQILECVQGIPKALLRVIKAFPSQLQECINDMVVKNKVSYSNSNDSDEFSWTWNAPDSANKIFPLCLTKLFHFQNCQVFLMHLVLKRPGHDAICHATEERE